MAKAKAGEFDPRKYMQMAIDEMKNSVAENRDDGKISPKVGAVLVFPDGTVETAHRDELRDGNHAEFTLLERKCVVKSPGAPLPSISLEQLNLFTAPSISRNPVITYIFNLMNYVEETGFGMKQIRELPETYKLPLPEYEFEEPFLTLTFPRNFEAVKNVSHIPGLADLNKEELEGYEYIKLKETVTRKQYQDAFEIESDKKAERHLRKMTELNLIRRIGSGRSVYYEIIPT